MMMRTRRTGRARVVDLVVYDVALLGVVIGLLYAEQKLPTREEMLAQAAARANPPRPPAATEEPATERPAPIEARPTPAPEPTPRPTEVAAPADATREQVQRLVGEARAAFEGGDADGALEVLSGAGAALRASPAWTELGAPALARIEGELAAQDAWRAVLADAQVLADAGKAAELEALLARVGAKPGALGTERARATARGDKKPGAGAQFQIRGFVPDEHRLEGRRCAVQGGVDRKHLEQVRDALDALLLVAVEKLGADLGDRLVLEVLAEDAPARPPAQARVSTHARANEPAAELVARAQLVAARAVVAFAAPNAAAWAREAIVRTLAGTRPHATSDRPAFTAAGRTWRRRALATVTGPRLLETMTSATPDPSLAFALGVAALWGGEPDAPLSRALDGARQGRDHALTPDEARALASALPSLLEPP